MKLLLLTASLLGLTLAIHAAEPSPTPPTPAAKKAEPSKGEEDKPMPMHHKVDAIDAKEKTFTYATQKGAKVVHIVTPKTEILQDGKPAQFSDIKVGDVVSGLHIKRGEDRYEVIKITKFGPETPKTTDKAKTETAAPEVKKDTPLKK